MFRKSAFATAVAVGMFSPAALAGPSHSHYALRRQGMGPRPDRYVWQRVDRGRDDHPSAVARDGDRPPKRRVVQRWAGRRYIGPVTVFE